jgi:hypothetical protein
MAQMCAFGGGGVVVAVRQKGLDYVRKYPNLCTNRYSNTPFCINSYRLTFHDTFY